MLLRSHSEVHRRFSSRSHNTLLVVVEGGGVLPSGPGQLLTALQSPSKALEN